MASPIRIAGTLLRFAGPVLIILVGAFIARTLVAGRKAPERTAPVEARMQVEVVTVQSRSHVATLPTYGVVQPLRSQIVRPLVPGVVLEVHPSLISGGRIDAGETLFQLDQREYDLALQTAEAALLGAQADLDVELGTAAVAAKEWELLDGSVEVTPEGKRLALREPYVARRRADLDSAKARVDQARLDLERTRVQSPFDCLVLSENLEVGSQLGAGTQAASIVDRTAFLVEVNVAQSLLASIDLGGEASIALGEAPDGDSPAPPRIGRIERLLGEVDAAGRMARLQVSVPDPLPGDGSAAPVLLGSFVEVGLPARTLENAFSVPRAAVRENDIVWIVDAENRLAMRQVEVVLRRSNDVLVAAGLVDGDRVVVSPIAVPLPGMGLSPVERADALPLGESAPAAEDPDGGAPAPGAIR